MKFTSTHFIIAVVVLVFVALLGYHFIATSTSSLATKSQEANGESSTNYDSFATCIAQSGTKFYGAFWCPHCHDQKLQFGSSTALLPYVECSTPDKSGQTQVCIDAGIKGYPTWEFPDGSRLTGVQSMQTLSDKTGCLLPQS